MLPLLALGDAKLKFSMGNESVVVDKFISVLALNNPDIVADSIVYPDTFTPDDLAKDKAGVKGVYRILHKDFGEIGGLSVAGDDKEFYEVGITGGSIFWWSSEKGVTTKKYIYTVVFSNYGEGFVKIFTSNNKGVEKVVGFYYGLPVTDGKSKPKLISTMHRVLDLLGIPDNHPYRKNMESSFPVNERL